MMSVLSTGGRKVPKAVARSTAGLTTQRKLNHHIPREKLIAFPYLLRPASDHHGRLYRHMATPDAEDPHDRTNLSFEMQSPQPVYDIRGKESMFDTDKHGFAACTWPSRLSPQDFDNPSMIQHVYLAEIEELFRYNIKGTHLIKNVHYHVGQYIPVKEPSLNNCLAAPSARQGPSDRELPAR